ncbi:MAG: hypothetical protein QOH25_2950 [Acidobacteriota bacterium]|jgi:hypothetical protein|nr:hypothetical protein [Acidobacteriota bacterium]
MKNCPSCHTTYPDDGPEYCVNDGTPLVSSDPSYSPGGQWNAPPPQNWGYPPPLPPDSASPPGAARLASTALIMGIIATASLILGFLLSASASNSYYGPNVGMIKFASILFILMFITGLTAINLGLVALSMSGQNPSRKAKSIIGLCLGFLPFLLIIILFMAANGPRLRF